MNEHQRTTEPATPESLAGQAMSEPLADPTAPEFLGNPGTSEPLADPATPELLHVEQVSSGWVNKYLLTYRMPDGSHIEYEAASRKGLERYEAALRANAAVATGGPAPQPDAVCIVPLLPNDTVLLIREFRYPLNAWCLSFPAGLMEPGETIRQCAQRELMEEVGCRINPAYGDNATLVLRQAGYSSTGLTEENVQVVMARVIRDGAPQPEPNELIEQIELPYAEVGQFLATTTDLIGTRAQLILEHIRRIWGHRRKQPLPQEPMTRQDFA